MQINYTEQELEIVISGEKINLSRGESSLQMFTTWYQHEMVLLHINNSQCVLVNVEAPHCPNFLEIICSLMSTRSPDGFMQS